MRKIGPAAITVFFILLSLVLGLAAATAWFGVGRIAALGDFRGVLVSAAAILLIYLYGIVVYRIFLRVMPLHEGDIAAGSSQEFVYHVYVLFYLILFNSLIRGGIIPIPIMRLVYLALGARLGDNTYSSGIIYDPLFVRIGANSVGGGRDRLVGSPRYRRQQAGTLPDRDRRQRHRGHPLGDFVRRDHRRQRDRRGQLAGGQGHTDQ
jgi:hypothetical protein